MASLRVLNGLGDKAVLWDVEQVNAGDTEAVAAVREAERIFTIARQKGATAFKMTPGQPAERIDSFELEADTIIVPRIAGG